MAVAVRELDRDRAGARASGALQRDDRLIEALRARQPDALEQLLDAYGKLVLAWARDAGTDPEDVLQDVMLRVWRSCHRLTPDTHLPAWLKAVTKNTIRDRWRAAARRPAFPVGLDPTGGETVDPTAQERSRLAVQQVLTTLRDRERNVLELLYLDDLPLDEVSRRLDLSEQATKSLAARARRRLRGNLERLVASTPGGVIHLLVGRAAEAGQGVTRSLGNAGAALLATAAATAVVAGGVSVDRAREGVPERPPDMAALHEMADRRGAGGAIGDDFVIVRAAPTREAASQEAGVGDAEPGGPAGTAPRARGPEDAPGGGGADTASGGGPPAHAGQGGPPEHAGQGGGNAPQDPGSQGKGVGHGPDAAPRGDGKPDTPGGGGDGQGRSGEGTGRPECTGPPKDRPADCDGADREQGPGASGGNESRGQRPA